MDLFCYYTVITVLVYVVFYIFSSSLLFFIVIRRYYFCSASDSTYCDTFLRRLVRLFVCHNRAPCLNGSTDGIWIPLGRCTFGVLLPVSIRTSLATFSKNDMQHCVYSTVTLGQPVSSLMSAVIKRVDNSTVVEESCVVNRMTMLPADTHTQTVDDRRPRNEKWLNHCNALQCNVRCYQSHCSQWMVLVWRSCVIGGLCTW